MRFADLGKLTNLVTRKMIRRTKVKMKMKMPMIG